MLTFTCHLLLEGKEARPVNPPRLWGPSLLKIKELPMERDVLLFSAKELGGTNPVAAFKEARQTLLHSVPLRPQGATQHIRMQTPLGADPYRNPSPVQTVLRGDSGLIKFGIQAVDKPSKDWRD